MEIIRGINNLVNKHKGCVATIGNFDGMHLGHCALLKKLVAKAQQLHLPAVAIIFEPQPNEFFTTDKSTPRLMRFREKIEMLQEQGIDRVLCIKFSKNFAEMSAEDFVTKILVEKLAVKYVLVGDDFRFGCKRSGDINLLRVMGQQHHFLAESMATILIEGERVSSTRIRDLLQKGDLATAAKLLGRSFSMKGRVAHGDKRGRLLGFPTANIHLHRRVVPLSGVFIVAVKGLGKKPLPGVANIGVRPTIAGETRTLLEVYILDFNQDIYRKQVEIQFLHKLRDEKKFASLEELQSQIQQDVEESYVFITK